MASLGFGLERIAWYALRRPRVIGALFLVVLCLAVFGTTRLSFDSDMRNVFASDSQLYDAYIKATNDFVDPENELLILIEGESLAEPESFLLLQDLHFELQFLDGVDSVFSIFALRQRPDAAGNSAPVVATTDLGLTPQLAEQIRNHPIMGAKLLSGDGKSMVFVLTPALKKAHMGYARELQLTVDSTVADVLADSDLKVTVTGFPVIRADIVDILKRDQIVLNLVGALLGLLMSLLVFRSLTAALMTAIPAILGGFTVVGFMGLLGVQVTVMSTVVPAVVMILGYADGMHLSFVFRRARDGGASVAEAEMKAQRDVGGACVLAAITTSVAFASLTLSDVAIVRSFGATGAVATTVGTLVILVAHSLVALVVARFWQRSSGQTRSFLRWMEGPSAALGRFAVRFSRPVALVAVLLLSVFAWMHYSVPAQHSVREHLPHRNVANAALGRIDQNFDGIFPVQVVVPVGSAGVVTPEGLARVSRVHEAIAAIGPISTPLSLWSLVEWLGGGADEETAAAINTLMAGLSPTTRSRFLNEEGGAMVTGNTKEASTEETRPIVNSAIIAARAAGGDDVDVTGVTVITVLESARTISNLNISLTLSVIANLAVIAFAFRSLPIGIISFLPNILPILATGAILYLTGRGMQFTSVIALTVAFGIAVDDTVHFLNRYLIMGEENLPMPERLIGTARSVGPALFGTTIVIITGLASTLTSGLPTIALFGQIAMTALAIALIGDLLFLPALIQVFAKRWPNSSLAGMVQTKKVVS
jgi:predicted RND superfamily exporter protein